MISAKQLAANQANAHWSTGPRTPEGKAITRLNAVQHGLTGQLTIVAPDAHAAFAALSQRLADALKPAGEQELQIALRIARDTWRLQRAAAHEENIYAIGLIENGCQKFLAQPHTEEPQTKQETGNADAVPDPGLDPARIAFTNARTFFNKLRDFNLAGLYEQRIHRTLMKDYALLRQLQQDRKREEAKELTKPRPTVVLKAAAANGSDFSSIYELPFAPAGGPKIEPELINSVPPHLAPPAKSTPEAHKAA